MQKGKVELTDSNVAKLKAKPTKYAVWDKTCPGFGVEVTTAGTKLLVAKTCTTLHTPAGLKQVRNWFTLGTWPMLKVGDARQRAYDLKDQVKQGIDPKAAAKAKKSAVRMDELIDRFIEEHIGAKVTWEGKEYKVEMLTDAKTGKPVGNKQSTAMEHIRLLFKEIKPALGAFNVKDVGTSDIASFLFRLRKDTPIMANRVRSVLSKMFAEAEIWELRPAGSNPCKGQKRAPENKKDRHLSDKELAALGATLRTIEAVSRKPESERAADDPREEDAFALAALKLILLTGMRKSELIGDRSKGIPALTWSDVDLDAGTLLVSHKTETKTGKKRVVHLCEAAKSILQGMDAHIANANVIPGRRHGQSLVNLQAVWERVRRHVTETAIRAANESGRKTPEFNLEDVTIHDLRRTFSSMGARLGFSELWIGALLGHSAGTVTAGYARVNADPLKIAVEDIGGRIAGLLSGEINLEQEAQEALRAKTKVRA